MAEMEMVQIPQWNGIRWLRHGFSTRSGGVSTVYGDKSLNLGWTKEDLPGHVAENRRILVKKVSGGMTEPMKLVTSRQVHSNEVKIVRGEEVFEGVLETKEGKAVLEGDGLVTGAAGVLLGAGTADCVPVLVVDPVRRAVGAFHAGWRGTVARMAIHGVEAMKKEYGSRPEDLLAAVGPSIGVCCYTVGAEVCERFDSEFPDAADLFQREKRDEGTPELRVDLWKANQRQLLEAGVLPGRITVVGECTACTFDGQGRRKYFSHRADAGKTGRMLNVIGVSAK